MTRKRMWLAGAALALLAATIPLVAYAESGHWFPLPLLLKSGIKGLNTGATMSVTSGTSAATATSAVAALTFAPTATLDANDLVAEVNNAAGSQLFAVDLEGDVFATGDVSLAGNDAKCTGTAATCLLSSATADGTTSATVGAITLKATADITDTDLLLDVQDSAANHRLTMDESGAVTLASTKTRGTCTLDGASPSVCTATVLAGALCVCSNVGATAAIAANGCAVGVSSTTLTITSANGATNVVNYHCF